MMPSPTESSNVVEAHMVSMCGKLTVLPYLPYLLTIPYGIYRLMPSPTDLPNVVESHMVSMYGKYVSMVRNSQILSYALPPRPCYSYTAQQRDSYSKILRFSGFSDSQSLCGSG